MSESLHGIEESYLLMHTEVAWELAFRLREAKWTGQPRLFSRSDEHRLLESVNAIASILGVSGRDVWVDYVESPYCYECGHGCVCGKGRQ